MAVVREEEQCHPVVQGEAPALSLARQPFPFYLSALSAKQTLQ